MKLSRRNFTAAAFDAKHAELTEKVVKDDGAITKHGSDANAQASPRGCSRAKSRRLEAARANSSISHQQCSRTRREPETFPDRLARLAPLDPM
jgi:hypothetical protein